MPGLSHVVNEFLSSRRIAVAGVSRTPNQPGNAIYQKLRSTGHSVVAINPRTDRVEGDPCYPDLRSAPAGVDALIIATPPAAALQLVQQCDELGIRRVWFHRSFGQGSLSAQAVEYCNEKGIAVIAGACPLMYCPPVDVGHRCMRTVLGWFGRLPRPQG